MSRKRRFAPSIGTNSGAVSADLSSTHPAATESCCVSTFQGEVSLLRYTGMFRLPALATTTARRAHDRKPSLGKRSLNKDSVTGVGEEAAGSSVSPVMCPVEPFFRAHATLPVLIPECKLSDRFSWLVSPFSSPDNRWTMSGESRPAGAQLSLSELQDSRAGHCRRTFPLWMISR